MELMKRSLAQQKDKLCVWQSYGPGIGIEIDQSAARGVKALIHAAELAPQISPHKQGIGFVDRLEPTIHRRFVPGGDFEQAIPIIWPVDRLEQLVFARLIVSGSHRPALKVVAEIPTGCRDHGIRIEVSAMTRKVNKTRCHDACAIYHYSN